MTLHHWLGQPSYLPQTECKIELPCTCSRRTFSVLIEEGDTELNDLQQITIALECLVVVVGGCLEVSQRSRYDAREFSILEMESKGRWEEEKNEYNDKKGIHIQQVSSHR